MNTHRSDGLKAEWNAKKNPLKRSTLILERTFDASPEVVFPLLCPTTEYDWISTWECELLHSVSGCAEHNAIFRTHQSGVEEIWVCTRYEPPREIHYTRLSPGLCTKLEINLLGMREGATTVRWSLTASALTEEMNPAVADLDPDGRRIRILEHLLDDLEFYLDTGEMRV